MDSDSPENGSSESSFSGSFSSEQTKPTFVDASVQLDGTEDCLSETEFQAIDVQNFANTIVSSIDMKMPITIQNCVPLNLHAPSELLVIAGNGTDMLNEPKMPLMPLQTVDDVSAGRRFCIDSVGLEQHGQTYIVSLQDGLASIVEVVDQKVPVVADTSEITSARQNVKIASKQGINQNWFTSKAEKATLHKSGHVWKQGMWSKEEIDLLESNIREYCERRDITTPATVIFEMAKDERKDFYRTIAKGLNRPLFSVYRRVIRMYDNKNHVGKYTTEELEKLKQLRSLYGNNWQAIGSAMGRSASSIKDRCRLMKDNCNQGKWLPAEEKRLAEAVYDLANVLPGEMISSGLSWAEVAERVGTRSEKQCRTKWLNYLNWKEAGGTEWTREDDVTLIYRISMMNATDENQVDWNELAKGWMSARSPQWLRGKWWNLKRHAANANSIPFPDLCEYLYEQFVLKLKLAAGENLTSVTSSSSLVDGNLCPDSVQQQQVLAQPESSVVHSLAGDGSPSEIVVTDVSVDCLPTVVTIPTTHHIELENDVFPTLQLAQKIETLGVLADPTVQLTTSNQPFLTTAHTVQSIPLAAALTKAPIVIHTLPVNNVESPDTADTDRADNSSPSPQSPPLTCLASTQTSSNPSSPHPCDEVQLDESHNLLHDEMNFDSEDNNEHQENTIIQDGELCKGSPTVHFILTDPMLTLAGHQRSDHTEFIEKTVSDQGCGTDD